MGPYGPQPGQGPNPDRAPTRTGPQPGPGEWFESEFMTTQNKILSVGIFWAHMGPQGPIWAPTRTGPQPGLGPNPDYLCDF